MEGLPLPFPGHALAVWYRPIHAGATATLSSSPRGQEAVFLSTKLVFIRHQVHRSTLRRFIVERHSGVCQLTWVPPRLWALAVIRGIPHGDAAGRDLAE